VFWPVDFTALNYALVDSLIALMG